MKFRNIFTAVVSTLYLLNGFAGTDLIDSTDEKEKRVKTAEWVEKKRKSLNEASVVRFIFEYEGRSDPFDFKRAPPQNGKKEELVVFEMSQPKMDDTLAEYRRLLSPYLKIIVQKAKERHLPPELPFFTLGSEAEYLESGNPADTLEEWVSKIPGVEDLAAASFPINTWGGKRTIADLTLGIGQMTIKILNELIAKNYIHVQLPFPFSKKVKFLETPATSIETHIAYLEMVANEAGIPVEKRSDTIPMMQLMYSHYAFMAEDRFQAFSNPLKILELILKENPRYPSHSFEDQWAYACLLWPASKQSRKLARDYLFN